MHIADNIASIERKNKVNGKKTTGDVVGIKFLNQTGIRQLDVWG